MKHYKFKQRQDELRKRQKGKFDRKNILLKETRKLALHYFKANIARGFAHHNAGLWDNDRDKMAFEYYLYSATKKQFNIQVGELEMMYPIFTKYVDALREREKKANIIKEKYIPLEEHLFHV